MWLFKDRKKLTVEAYIDSLLDHQLPKAIQFFNKENSRAREHLTIPDDQLVEIGAALLLFFLGRHFPDTKKENLAIMSRAYVQVEKRLPDLGGNPKQAYSWWKVFTDVLIFKESEDRLNVACRQVWEKLFPDKTFRDASPLRTYAYFLEMEITEAAKLNIA